MSNLLAFEDINTSYSSVCQIAVVLTCVNSPFWLCGEKKIMFFNCGSHNELGKSEAKMDPFQPVAHCLKFLRHASP